MRNFAQLLAAVGLAATLFSACAQADTLADQQSFARKMDELRRKDDHDYAKAAMLKYLEFVPNAAPVKRELATLYMDTLALRHEDGLIEFYYPDDIGQEIIDLLDQAIETSPDDPLALSYLVAMHAFQGNVALGQVALDKANELNNKHESLTHNAALLAVRDNRISDAVDLLQTIGVGRYGRNYRDTRGYYSSAWALQRRIARAHPEYETVQAIREGLATRIDVNQLPEYYVDYDPSGPPILLFFNSEDHICKVCTAAMESFYTFAQRNKKQGDKYHVIYTSVEPWRIMKNYAYFLNSMYIKTVPTYIVTNKGEHVAKWSGSKTKPLIKMLENYDSFLSNGNISMEVAPRSVYLLDHMLNKFKEYQQNNSGDEKAMAFAIDGGYSKVENASGYASQESANEAALKGCQAVLDKRENSVACRLYASGDTIVDAVALEHNKAREAAVRKLKRKRAKRKNDISAEKGNNKLPSKAKSSNAKATKKPVTQEIVATISSTIQQFTKIEEHYKALAIAQDGDAFVSGSASKEITQFSANQKALANCDEALHETSIGAACLLHTIGNSEITDQSEKVIQKLTARQQKKNAKHSALNSSYRKYRKFSDDKAYAISTDNDGQWVYGMAFGKRGEDKATAGALSACEEKRADANMPNACRILILNSKFVEQVK